MSQQAVGLVIDRLLTDEELRTRFAMEPVETLADMHLRGFELTPDEIDAFMRTDVRIWFWSAHPSGGRVH
jgi:hypothetical protein